MVLFIIGFDRISASSSPSAAVRATTVAAAVAKADIVDHIV